jgi:hypothetical protein
MAVVEIVFLESCLMEVQRSALCCSEILFRQCAKAKESRLKVENERLEDQGPRPKANGKMLLLEL